MRLLQPNPKAVARPMPSGALLPAAALLAIILLFLSAALTQAALEAPLGNIVVNTLADQFGADVNSCSLREAILTANANSNFGGCAGSGGSQTIALGAGAHTLSIGGNGDDTDAIGDLDVTASLSIVGLGPLSTTITASGAFSDRLVHIGPGVSVVISGVRLTGADARDNGFGAAIFTEGHLTLINSVVDNNTSSSTGGGIAVDPLGTALIQSSAITGNLANNAGGGIRAGGPITIMDSTIGDNGFVDADSRGGGISLANNAPLVLIRSVVSGNSAPVRGGGLSLGGGAVTIVDSTIRNNSAADSGGIILEKGSLVLRNTALISNSATSAAGMRVTNTLATLINSTVSGNIAQAGAGGIAVNTAGGRLYLYNSTIAGNTADAANTGGNGGGLNIQAGSVVSMTNSVLANNVDLGASGDSPDCFGTIHLVAYNHVESTAGCTTTGPATGNVTGSDPNLRALTANGGLTLSHLPNAGSPLIDSGDPAGCADPAGGVLLTDQRGFFRPVNGGSALRCDKGATERGSFQMRLALPMIAR